MTSPRRSTVLKFLASGLLAIGASLALLPSVKNREPAQSQSDLTKVARTKPSRSAVASTHRPIEDSAPVSTTRQIASPPSDKTDEEDARIDQQQQTTNIPVKTSKTSALNNQATESENQAVAKPNTEPSTQAIQLADNVRLPAALMPSEQINVTPEVAAATSEIVNNFYRDLQAEITHSQIDPGTFDIETNTAIIQNTPKTKQTRQNADEQYRALYGDSQYNRYTIDSAIEVNLLTESAQPEH